MAILLELWLDLRGTAITPQMALSKLEEDSVLPASKVVVSVQDAGRATQLQDESGDPDTLMVIDENDCSLCSAKDPTISYGTVVTVDGVSFVDPIPALESISNGGWAFVDSEGGSDKIAERHEAISNLVDFIAGGLSLDSFSFGGPVMRVLEMAICLSRTRRTEEVLPLLAKQRQTWFRRQTVSSLLVQEV